MPPRRCGSSCRGAFFAVADCCSVRQAYETLRRYPEVTNVVDSLGESEDAEVRSGNLYIQLSVTLVAARRDWWKSARRAAPLAAFATAQPTRYILELGIPTANVGERLGKYSPFMSADFALQHQIILSEFVGELFDFESAAHPAHVSPYRL